MSQFQANPRKALFFVPRWLALFLTLCLSLPAGVYPEPSRGTLRAEAKQESHPEDLTVELKPPLAAGLEELPEEIRRPLKAALSSLGRKDPLLRRLLEEHLLPMLISPHSQSEYREIVSRAQNLVAEMAETGGYSPLELRALNGIVKGLSHRGITAYTLNLLNTHLLLPRGFVFNIRPGGLYLGAVEGYELHRISGSQVLVAVVYTRDPKLLGPLGREQTELYGLAFVGVGHPAQEMKGDRLEGLAHAVDSVKLNLVLIPASVRGVLQGVPFQQGATLPAYLRLASRRKVPLAMDILLETRAGLRQMHSGLVDANDQEQINIIWEEYPGVLGYFREFFRGNRPARRWLEGLFLGMGWDHLTGRDYAFLWIAARMHALDPNASLEPAPLAKMARTIWEAEFSVSADPIRIPARRIYPRTAKEAGEQLLRLSSEGGSQQKGGLEEKPVDPLKEPVAAKQARDMFDYVGRILSGKELVSDFLWPPESNPLAYSRRSQFLHARMTGSVDATLEIYNKLSETIGRAERRLELYLRGVRTLETLPRISRIILQIAWHNGMGGIKTKHPAVGKKELKVFAEKYWDFSDQGKIPDAARAEIWERMKVGESWGSRASRFLHLEDEEPFAGPSDERLVKAFSAIEAVLRSPEYKAPRSKSERRGVRGPAVLEADPLEPLHQLRDRWRELSLDAVQRLIDTAPQKEKQPIGAGTPLHISDQVGRKEDRIHKEDDDQTLGRLQTRLKTGPMGIVVERSGSRVLFRILNKGMDRRDENPSARSEAIRRLKKSIRSVELFLEKYPYANLFLDSAGLEEMREFGTVEKFLEEFSGRVRGMDLSKAAEPFRAANHILVLPGSDLTEAVLAFTHPEWVEAVKDQLRSDFILAEAYPINGKVVPRSVVIQEEGIEIAKPNPAVPILVLRSLKDISELTPGFVYAVAVNRALAGKIVGPIIGILTFQDEKGRTFTALFA
ncbi:MAG: hypothetical protein HY211_02385 [Candidatus Omnitrophica bacterium]|nr:hypothetical protein [Candidatus Omnitrophota bacterium]